MVDGTAMNVEQYDRHKRRCPMLGHEVAFGYCREYRDGLPCRRVFDCWFEQFDINTFMRGHYTEEQIEQITAPPREKIVSLYECIQKARNMCSQSEKGE